MNEPPARPDGIEFRAARAEDYAELIALWSVASLNVHPDGRESEPAFREQVRLFGDAYLVATEKNRIIGVVLGTHDTRKGWINRLAVHPNGRRRGIAAELVRRCEAALRARGLEIVAALVERTNAESIRVFEAAGFKADIPVHYFRKSCEGDKSC